MSGTSSPSVPAGMLPPSPTLCNASTCTRTRAISTNATIISFPNFVWIRSKSDRRDDAVAGGCADVLGDRREEEETAEVEPLGRALTRTIGTGRSDEDLVFTDAALVRLRTTRPPDAVSSDVGAVFRFALSFFAAADVSEKVHPPFFEILQKLHRFLSFLFWRNLENARKQISRWESTQRAHWIVGISRDE